MAGSVITMYEGLARGELSWAQQPLLVLNISYEECKLLLLSEKRGLTVMLKQHSFALASEVE